MEIQFPRRPSIFVRNLRFKFLIRIFIAEFFDIRILYYRLQYAVIGFFRLGIFIKQQRITGLPAKIGQPAVRIQKVPNRHSRNICLPVLFGIYQQPEQFLIPVRQRLHGFLRGIRIVNIQFRQLYLDPQCAILIQCFPKQVDPRKVHHKVRLHTKAVHQSFFL